MTSSLESTSMYSSDEYYSMRTASAPPSPLSLSSKGFGLCKSQSQLDKSIISRAHSYEDFMTAARRKVAVVSPRLSQSNPCTPSSDQPSTKETSKQLSDHITDGNDVVVHSSSPKVNKEMEHVETTFIKNSHSLFPRRLVKL